MKKAVLFPVIFFAVALADYVLPVYGTAGEKIHHMRGEITAIEPPTVVIEVPLEKGMFTVAGPLSEYAVLKRHGESASLVDFVAGDRVDVTWRGNSGGHIIEQMQLLDAESSVWGKTYQMRGKITVIEPAHSTAVIEVPLEKGMFTVAGPLSEYAVLRNRGASAALTDFVSGDEVIVRWRATGQGHIIDEIIEE